MGKFRGRGGQEPVPKTVRGPNVCRGRGGAVHVYQIQVTEIAYFNDCQNGYATACVSILGSKNKLGLNNCPISHKHL